MMFENWCDEAERSLQQHVLLPKLAVLDLLANLHLQQIDVERLAQIVAGAETHRLDRVSVDANAVIMIPRMS